MAEELYIIAHNNGGNTESDRVEKISDKKAEIKAALGFIEMFTGSYTGDGTTSLAITGLGFKPKYVKIFERSTSDGTAISIIETTDEIIDDNASGMAAVHSGDTNEHTLQTNTVISFDDDGFTVDDDSADAHPNKSGQVYNYVAFG